MFSSVSKFVQEKSAIAVTKLQQAAAETTEKYLPEKFCVNVNDPNVKNCKGNISIATMYGAKIGANQCRLCSKVFCSNCVKKTNFLVPDSLLSELFKKQKVDDDDKAQLLCNDCCQVARAEAQRLFQKDMYETYTPFVQQYIVKSEQLKDFPTDSWRTLLPVQFFPLPEEEKDNRKRKLLRAVHMASLVANVTGVDYARYLQAVKVAYAGMNFASFFISLDAQNFISPMLKALTLYGITGTAAVTMVYYLSCRHLLDVKRRDAWAEQEAIEGDGEESCGDRTAFRHGYLASSPLSASRKEWLGLCPNTVLRRLQEYASVSQWLYISGTPAPRTTNDWSSWHLAKIIQRKGWTLLMCMNDATMLPDKSKCPAFALVARKLPSHSHPSSQPSSPLGFASEVVLMIRGSKSSMDWAINFEETAVPFDYRLVDTDTKKASTVSGQVHKGIYSGVMGIMDSYNVRSYLLQLMTDFGYSVRVVGHSLGAGTAVLCAAELRKSLRAAMDVNSDARESLCEKVTAVAFACPCIVTENLADAFAADALLVNVVHGDDVVPRISRRTMALLAQELKSEELKKEADQWYESDKAAWKQRITSLGKMTSARGRASEKGLVREESLDNCNENALPSSPSSQAPASPGEERGLRSSLTNDEMLDFTDSSMPLSEGSQGSGDAQSLTNSDDAAIRSKHDDFPVLVSPGVIVYLYKNRDDLLEASLITSRHPAMHRLLLLATTAKKLHSIRTTRQAIEGIVARERGKGREAAICLPNLSLHDGLESASYAREPCEASSLSSLSSSASLARSSKEESKSHWTKCAVCALDCVWPYVMQSEPTRAFVTHRCGKCGCICCSICAPFGDKLPGEGLNQNIYLDDLSIALPHRGIFVPQRVCLPCYLE